MATTRRELIFTVDDQADEGYQQVPVGADSLEVRISVAGIDGAAVVDLGCLGAAE